MNTLLKILVDKTDKLVNEAREEFLTKNLMLQEQYKKGDKDGREVIF